MSNILQYFQAVIVSAKKSSQKGKLFILSAPSGGGKSSVLKAILESNPEFYYSISFTTRKPRVGEIDGTHYHFIGQQDFYDMARAGEFLEYAKVHSNYYGTSRKMIIDKLEKGKACFLDIDVQGMKQILESSKRLHIEQHIESIFISPPSMQVLEQRLRNRKSDTEKTILRRLRNAKREMDKADNYDNQLINNVLSDTITEVKKIIAQNGFTVK